MARHKKMSDDPESSSLKKIDIIIDEMDAGGVVALYRRRFEMGTRAWGHQSILADPRRQGMKCFVNDSVKGRKCFHPFAPRVLEEYTDEWFDMS